VGPVAILLLALAVSLDAAAVAAARGMLVPRVALKHVLGIALAFGGAQAAMPLIGFGIGSSFGPWIEKIDHWIAFGLLGALGLKMILDARKGDDEAEVSGDPFAPRTIFVLSIATSIDAFAVGMTLPMVGAPLWPTLAAIGAVTASLSGVAVLLGARFGQLFGKKLGAFGGLVLIGLGAKILYEHLNL
jgi:manganese efflux pump family protein